MIILKQPWGHLGDNLQISTIPETAFNHFGKKDVYISNYNACFNPEIHKLIWEMNPYIAGFINQDNSFIQWKMRPEGHIASIEYAYGLPPVSRIPKIYYNYSDVKKEFYKNKCFIDLHSSQENFIRIQRSKNNFPIFFQNFKSDCEVYQIGFKNVEFVQNYSLEFPVYEIESLFEYCDLIKYCKRFITCWSGLSALVSAIKRESELPKAE